MKQTVGIVGAGILGRLLAFQLSSKGCSVTLIDRDNQTASKSCSFAAAGMLAPFCELDTTELIIWKLGFESLKIWPNILANLSTFVYFQKSGSLVVAHPYDIAELDRFKRIIFSKIIPAQKELPQKLSAYIQEVGETEIKKMEPEIDPKLSHGIFFPLEAQIDNRSILEVLGNELFNRKVTCMFTEKEVSLSPHTIHCSKGKLSFDWVIDCRGIQANLPDLRPIRGELIILESKEVTFNRPIRLLHPRYTIYIVPRPKDRFIVGATSIESNDTSPISVRSALELLSAAFTVHTGLAEARIIETVTSLRPAFPDHLPRIQYQKGVIHINGLYRHGFLISPKLVDLVINFLESQSIPNEYIRLFKEITKHEVIH